MVAEQYPWPAVDGYRQRLAAMVAGLALAGEVEVLTLVRADLPPEPPPPPLAGRVSWDAVVAGRARRTREWLPAWVRRGAPPRRVLGHDWTELRGRVAGRLADRSRPVDLVWYSHVDTWWHLRDLAGGIPGIVDFDNLENLALRLRRGTPPRPVPGATAGQRLSTAVRWAASRAFDVLDERRWDALQRRAAAASGAVVVCSELDVGRSGCANAVAIGNGATAPADPVRDRRRLRGDVPTLLFVGALDYEPNAEAVEWFVREVWPLLRAEQPSARVRLVGRGDQHVSWVGSVEGVELVGPVEDLGAELRAADVSVVPIRVGAGTRLKVVEALANHLPLVTTTVGCEGIEVRDGEHALVVDDPPGFAAACVRLLRDGELRQRLADRGSELFAQRYDWSRIHRRVAGLAREVADA